MRAAIVKNYLRIISGVKHYFDRVKLVDILERGIIKAIIVKIYRYSLKPQKFKKIIIMHNSEVLERMAQAFEPIDFWSKLKYKFKK